eukprot:TRINITY_DN14052_c1_g1_i1.p1 TRINITY_DN14052_c1_g1~~TRINITY_DN14052_c1_g1_i1.p1  ORF type:complete len:188 (+),score=28.28 TRINITY_DN14052_c1_g1_i1:217-780(+)
MKKLNSAQVDYDDYKKKLDDALYDYKLNKFYYDNYVYDDEIYSIDDEIEKEEKKKLESVRRIRYLKHQQNFVPNSKSDPPPPDPHNIFMECNNAYGELPPVDSDSDELLPDSDESLVDYNELSEVLSNAVSAALSNPKVVKTITKSLKQSKKKELGKSKKKDGKKRKTITRISNSMLFFRVQYSFFL